MGTMNALKGLTVPVASGGTGATTAETARTALGAAALGVTQVFSGAQITSITSLVSAGNHIAINFATSNDFSHTLTEDTTLDNPTNITEGQGGSIFLTQAASAKALAFGSYWDFPSGATPTVSTGSGARDTLHYKVRSSTQIEANLVKGNS